VYDYCDVMLVLTNFSSCQCHELPQHGCSSDIISFLCHYYDALDKNSDTSFQQLEKYMCGIYGSTSFNSQYRCS